MSAHTPGPWAIRIGADRTPLVMSSADVAVAHVYMQRFQVGRGAKEAETAANARLIAAAPDLLALLQETLKPGAYGTGSTLAARIESAIAKATGAA